MSFEGTRVSFSTRDNKDHSGLKWLKKSHFNLNEDASEARIRVFRLFFRLKWQPNSEFMRHFLKFFTTVFLRRGARSCFENQATQQWMRRRCVESKYRWFYVFRVWAMRWQCCHKILGRWSCDIVTLLLHSVPHCVCIRFILDKAAWQNGRRKTQR